MGTLAIATPSLPSPEILSPRPDLRPHMEGLRTGAKYLKTGTMYIAYHGARLRAADGWKDFGFESEEDCRDKLGIPRSTWYKFIRIGEALIALSLEDLQQITIGNAELLIQVAPELWADYPWVQEAKRLSGGAFAELIVMRNQTAGSDREPMTYVRWQVPYSAKAAIEEMVEAFMQREGLKTTGHALEMLVADTYDRPNMGSLLHRAKYELRTCITELGRDHVGLEMRKRFVAQLEQVWRELNAGYEKEIRKADYATSD